MTEEGQIPDLNDVGVPVRPDLGHVPQLRHKLAQYLPVRSSVQKEEALIIEHPRPSPLSNEPVTITNRE